MGGLRVALQRRIPIFQRSPPTPLHLAPLIATPQTLQGPTCMFDFAGGLYRRACQHWEANSLQALRDRHITPVLKGPIGSAPFTRTLDGTRLAAATSPPSSNPSFIMSQLCGHRVEPQRVACLASWRME